MGGDAPGSTTAPAASAAPNWRNQVTRGSLHSLMTFDALGAADFLGDTPLLVVHGKQDAYCAPSWPQSSTSAPRVRRRSAGWTPPGTSTCMTVSRMSPRPPAVAAFLRRRLAA